MNKYTIEDIEILRQKSGISYEEAVNLLEYHNGSLARALVDLEKNGRLKKNNASSSSSKGAKGIFNFLFRLRLKVSKEKVSIINLSSLFVVFVIVFAPHVAIIGLIVSLLLGYRINVDRNCKEFNNESFDNIVKNAKTNVQSTVNTFSQQFTQSKEETTKSEEKEETYTQPRTESAPSGTKPVNVQFPGGGSVDIREDDDGYHEADIQ